MFSGDASVWRGVGDCAGGNSNQRLQCNALSASPSRIFFLLPLVFVFKSLKL